MRQKLTSSVPILIIVFESIPSGLQKEVSKRDKEFKKFRMLLLTCSQLHSSLFLCQSAPSVLSPSSLERGGGGGGTSSCS